MRDEQASLHFNQRGKGSLERWSLVKKVGISDGTSFSWSLMSSPYPFSRWNHRTGAQFRTAYSTFRASGARVDTSTYWRITGAPPVRLQVSVSGRPGCVMLMYAV